MIIGVSDVAESVLSVGIYGEVGSVSTIDVVESTEVIDQRNGTVGEEIDKV